MTRAATYNAPLAWQDRFAKPSFDALLHEQKVQPRRILQLLCEYLDALPNVKRQVIWYGDAWKWTFEYTLHDARGRKLDTLCYVVPRTDAPILSVPLAESIIEKLPMRRLSKIVREGIKGAKCAISVHWATWTPTTQSDVTHLQDLLRRKHKLTLGAAEPQPENN